MPTSLFDAAQWLTYFPEHMDTRKSLWLVRDALDVDTLKENVFSLSIGSEAKDLGKAEPFLASFPSVFIALADPDMVQTVSEMLEEYAPSVPVLLPRKGAFQGCANCREVLAAGGEKRLSQLMMGAIERPAAGLLDMAEVERVDPMSQPSVLSGIQTLDASTGGFFAGELSVWTGKRGAGKSTLLGQVLLNAIDQGQRVCAYSGELSAWRFKDWISMQAAGSTHLTEQRDPFSGKLFYQIDPSIRPLLDDWWRGQFFLYDNKVASASDEDSILKTFEYAVRRYGCSVFLVDNLMSARFRAMRDSDFFRAQSSFTGRLVEFAKKHEVHIHLVAHPRKTSSRLEADDVGGSGDITNLADNVFSLERLDAVSAEEKGYDTVLTVLKNRSFGSTVSVGMSFDPRTRRFARPHELEKVYGWDRAAKQVTFKEIEDHGDMPF